MKHRLCSTPILSLPNLQQPFEMEIDASDYVVVAVLTQHGHLVAYHSETLSDTIRKYPTYDKEMYSIVQACCRSKHCIMGKETVVVLQKKNYWPKLRQDVSEYIRSCTTCAIAKLAIKNKGLYTPLPTRERPWESISMDYMSGLLSTKKGNDYVCVVVDRFSKMAILIVCNKSIIAEDTAKLLFERVCIHFGIPQTIISDRNNRFLNTFWSSL
jgi:uncharacterized Fe-S cluster protein YjdI